MKRLYRTALLAALLTLLLGTRALAMENTMLKVGIKYGDDALFSANLYNFDGLGLGYEMGYFDSERTFVPLGAQTSVRAVSMTADTNVYISGGASYRNAPSSYSAVIGAYHLELDTRFETCGEAEEAAQYENSFVAYLSGEYAVRVGQYLTKDAAQEAAAAWDGEESVHVVSPSRTGVMVTVTGSNRILFYFDCGGLRSLAMRPLPIEDETPVTWFKGNRYNGSFEYQRVTGGNINVINVVDLETYVKGVVAWEIGANSPLEAIKAQAVCARTYGAYSTRHSRSGFDLCTTTDCQVYQGVAASSARSDQAVEETAGEFLYYEGSPVLEAVYYSSNGGASESSENVWGGKVGYLRGKIDPYEAYIAPRIPGYKWSRTFSKSDLSQRLANKGYNIGTVTNVYVSEYSPTGNVVALTFEGTRGTKTLTRESCRTFLGLGSMRFTVSGGENSGAYCINSPKTLVKSLAGLFTVSGSGAAAPWSGSERETYVITSSGISALGKSSAADSDSFTFSGTGSGHNVGMSQWGAMAMAEQGMDYRDILQFYYTGVTIEPRR